MAINLIDEPNSRRGMKILQIKDKLEAHDKQFLNISFFIQALTLKQACIFLSFPQKIKGSGDGERNQRGKKRKKGNLRKI